MGQRQMEVDVLPLLLPVPLHPGALGGQPPYEAQVKTSQRSVKRHKGTTTSRSTLQREFKGEVVQRVNQRELA